MSETSSLPLSHDQLFKHLFKSRFEDLLKLVVPQLAPHLRASEAQFLDKETFTDLPQGTRNELDILARLPADDDTSELILVHVEVEGDATRGMGKRLWRYNMQLELRHDQPVIPIVVFLHGGDPDVQVERFTRTALGYQIYAFQYVSFGLSRSVAEAYLERPEPLAWALAALMRPHRLSPEELRIECLRRLAHADLPEAHRFLLLNCVQTYLILKGEAQRRYERLLAETENREIRTMEQTWAEKVEAEGIQKGLRQGLQQGIQQGVQLGTLKTLRGVLIKLLEQRFGTLPEPARTQVETMDDEATLQSLVSRVFTVQRLEELGLGR